MYRLSSVALRGDGTGHHLGQRFNPSRTFKFRLYSFDSSSRENVPEGNRISDIDASVDNSLRCGHHHSAAYRDDAHGVG